MKCLCWWRIDVKQPVNYAEVVSHIPGSEIASNWNIDVAEG